MFFEMLTKDNQPTIQGGNLNAANPGPDVSIGLYNTRGWLINTPWTPNAISSSWQTVTVPFGYLVPRHLTDSAHCTSGASATAICQPPAFVPADVIGIQVSFYDATSTNGSGFPTPSGSTPGTFDIWIDDVAFTTGDSGLQTISGFPLTNAGSMGSCKLPTGPAASAKYLVPAYNQWKANFVKGNKVVRPEAANDTVSEGQAYGMLIAVNMNDKTLFDSLYSGWTGNITTGTLMNWCLGSSGGGTGSACSASGGSATDADEDAAFALLQAAKVFGDASYKTKALAMIGDIWSKDIDASTKLPKGGSNYSSSATTNPSYFAPAYYNAFKAAGDSNDWASVNAAVYKAVNASTWTNGLLPAWCSGNTCTAPGSNPGSADPTTDGIYQYDAHRIPMRIGLDYCFNGTADAKTYTAKTTTFFATNANAGLYGIGRIFDMYQLNGTAAASTANNSASIIGTAAVGAMADGSNQKFINDAYQEVFDLVTRSSMSTIPPDKTPYSYYNATVGMLTLLMMTGNFSH
jgi:endo-1,4-beta-D-glucanase Y